MPDALTTLLNLKSASNYSPGGGGVANYTPDTRRNSATVGLLRKYFGLQGPDTGEVSQSDYENTFETLRQQEEAKARQEAEARAYPEQVRGEYSVATARERTRATQAAAEAAAQRAAEQREFQREQNDLNRRSSMDRTRFIQGQTTARTGTTQANITGRQQAGRNESRARMFETRDSSGNFRMNAPRPKNEGFLSRWLFGPSQEDLNREEAARLRQMPDTGTADDGDSDIMAAAQEYASMGLDPDQLEATLMRDQPDATPDELMQLMDAIDALREQ